MATFPDVRILGVDPGIRGAAAIFCPGSIVKVPPRGIIRLPLIEQEMTTKTKKGKRKIRRIIDVPAFLGWIQYHQPTHAFVEQVWAMPPKSEIDESGEEHKRDAGNASSFNFGRAYGEALTTIKCYGLTPVDVPPQSWQRTFELLGRDDDLDKGEASRLIAIQRHPYAEPFMMRKSDHNCAEALLIAEHGAIKLERLNVEDIEE